MHGQRRLLQLDGLRGLAALSVVLFHFTFRYDDLVAPRAGVWFRFAAGEFGVALFFMLSGFVILTSLERSGSPIEFARTRAWRLLPTFWIAVMLTFVVTSFAGLPSSRVSPIDALLNLTMLPHLLGARYVDGVYWSLEAELFFYAAIAGVWFTPARRWVSPIFAVWIVWGAVAHFSIPLVVEQAPRWGSLLGKASTLLNLPYIHLFAIGIGLYEFSAHRRRSGLVLVAVAVVAHFVEHGWLEGATLTALALLLAAAVWERLPWLAWRPLLFLGALSYPLYLTHQNIGYCLLRWFGSAGIEPNLAILLTLTAVLAIAWPLARYVEQPLARWGRSRNLAKRQAAQVSRIAPNLERSRTSLSGSLVPPRSQTDHAARGTAG